MCIVCLATQTFEPARHIHGSENPVNAAVFEGADAAENASTAYSIGVGDTFSGTLSSLSDEDWISISLTEGESITINMVGGSLDDPFLRLYDSTGTLITSNDDGGPGTDASITFTATASGTYFIEADSFSGDYGQSRTGSYTVEIVGAAPRETASLDELALFLTEGFWNGRELTYDTSQSNVITVNLSGLTADGQQLARWALEAWETVANIDFLEVSSGEMITFDDEEAGAFAFAPNSGSTSTANGDSRSGVELNISRAWLDTNGTSIDSYSFQTYLHEIGHALGLGHQGQYNGIGNYASDATFANDSWQISVMSYFSQTENTTTNATFGYAATLMIADILAIQNLYGAPVGGATAGDSIHGLNSNLGTYQDLLFAALASDTTNAIYTGAPVALTIFDESGTDTVDVSFADFGDRIDLNDETFSDVAGGIGNLAIARGTVLENLITGNGDDVIFTNGADNDIRTGGGNDTIFASGGSDTLNGGAGSDRLIFEFSFDQIISGDVTGSQAFLSGNGVTFTTISVESFEFSDQVFTLSQLSNALPTFPGIVFNGTSGDDRDVEGTAGDDTISGLGGNDSIFAYDGRDIINAGSGFDTVYGGNSNDAISGSAGFDLLFGEGGNDTLSGNNGNDTLSGGSENDMLNGGLGNDSLDGDAGDDTLIGLSGSDTLNGGTGNDVLNGNNGFDLLNGGDNNDLLDGGLANDTLNGDAGADTLNGNSGADELNGGNGNDVLNGNSGSDLLNGGSNDDTLNGGNNHDTLDGGSGNDRLNGGNGQDDLFGGLGNDVLLGNVGADTLHGGEGNDILNGGAANDTFIFSGGHDTIQDFQNNTDTLVLDQALLNGATPETVNINDFVNVANGNLILTFDQATSLQINGFTNFSVIADDFEFSFI